MKKIVLMVMVFCVVGTFNSVYGQTYVDLGLPSGTKWKDVNAKSRYSWGEAKELFGDKMPTKEQWEELESECKWTWEKGKNPGMRVTGPNGNSIFLPAAGDSGHSAGDSGHYWSSTSDHELYAWGFYFSSVKVSLSIPYRHHYQSVRLVQD